MYSHIAVKMLLFWVFLKEQGFMTSQVTTVFAFSQFCLHVLYTPEAGEKLMAVTASSSGDSSAREPMAVFWSDGAMASFNYKITLINIHYIKYINLITLIMKLLLFPKLTVKSW